MKVTETRDLAPASERLREQLESLRAEFARRAQIHDEGTSPVCGDFRRDDVELAQAHGALLEAELIVARLDALLSPADVHRDPGRARAAHTARSKRRHASEEAWRALPYYRRARFWRRLREALVGRYALHGGESPAQVVCLREQARDGLLAERAVREALRTKGRPSAAPWIALPSSLQSLALRRVREIAADVRGGAEREAAAVVASVLASWLSEEVGDECDIEAAGSDRA